MQDGRGLFELLLGDSWPRIPPAVRALHDGRARLVARGRADVDGGDSIAARLIRSSLRMPGPGKHVPIEIEIRRDGARETWRRAFPHACLVSHLQPSVRWKDAFDEDLGSTTVTFALKSDEHGLDWELRAIRVFGVPFPTRWFAGVRARCREEEGRYRFDVCVRLPLIGLLVAYAGWLEPVDADLQDRGGADQAQT